MQTLGTLAADPLASLVDTAYIGHVGECFCLTFRVLAFLAELDSTETVVRPFGRGTLACLGRGYRRGPAGLSGSDAACFRVGRQADASPLALGSMYLTYVRRRDLAGLGGEWCLSVGCQDDGALRVCRSPYLAYVRRCGPAGSRWEWRCPCLGRLRN